MFYAVLVTLVEPAIKKEENEKTCIKQIICISIVGNGQQWVAKTTIVHLIYLYLENQGQVRGRGGCQGRCRGPGAPHLPDIVPVVDAVLVAQSEMVVMAASSYFLHFLKIAVHFLRAILTFSASVGNLHCLTSWTVWAKLESVQQVQATSLGLVSRTVSVKQLSACSVN